MIKNNMNRPIGIIGNIEEGKEWLKSKLDPEALIYEIDNKSSIDEIKDFRLKIITQHVQQKIGIIYRFNKFSQSKQATLLKVFEELPEFNKCYFLASFLPNFTIITRSQIYYLKAHNNKELEQAKNFMIKQIQMKTLTQTMSNAWKVLLKTHSLYEDGIISEQEKSTIVRGLGIE